MAPAGCGSPAPQRAVPSVMVAWPMQVAASVVGAGGGTVVCEGGAAAELVGALRGCGDVRAAAEVVGTVRAADDVRAAAGVVGAIRAADDVGTAAAACVLDGGVVPVLVLVLCETLTCAGGDAEPEAVD
jgi:hypothetical protein